MGRVSINALSNASWELQSLELQLDYEAHHSVDYGLDCRIKSFGVHPNLGNRPFCIFLACITNTLTDARNRIRDFGLAAECLSHYGKAKWNRRHCSVSPLSKH